MSLGLNVSAVAKALPIASSLKGRAALVALPAAIITVSLFLGMRALVQVDDFTAPKDRAYTLSAYVIPTQTTFSEPKTVKPKRPKDIELPPEQTRERIEKVPVTLDGAYNGAAPAIYVEPRVEPLRPKTISSAIDRTARPLTPPSPVYPQRALERGLTGNCEVSMSVSASGKPYDVVASCSNPVFKASAERAVRKVLFSPRVEHGQRMELHGVVYPINYNITE